MHLGIHGYVACQIGLAIAIGLLFGFEREWSNKDAGIRTFSLTCLGGMLSALVGGGFVIAGFAAALVLVAFINYHGLQARQSVEITTSAALLLVYVMGVLVGQGEFFAPVMAAIVATLLLAWKFELHRLAGELHPDEIRGAIWLGFIAFVVYPLLPNRFVDPWQLVNPHAVWVAVIVVAAVGFGNYLLMRLYSARGMYYSALLGGLVSSTAAILEIGGALKRMGGDRDRAVDLGLSITLLATLAMFGRNLLLLALFAPGGVRTAALPLGVMSALAAVFVWQRRRPTAPGEPLELPSPVSLRRVLEFGLLFLIIAAVTTLAQRHAGEFGIYGVAVLGGFFSSASTTAAMGVLAAHHALAASSAGIATVVASMAGAVANAPVMNRVSGDHRLARANDLRVWALALAGGATLALGWIL
ncbi:MAG TPA: DUF4010 domain-containing protein [Terriglobales bacterium]